jgi:hypothetical protein
MSASMGPQAFPIALDARKARRRQPAGVSGSVTIPASVGGVLSSVIGFLYHDDGSTQSLTHS